MAMPLELLLVRHGESEANVIHKNKNGQFSQEMVERNNARPDSLHPLTARGIEQAKKAGEWIRTHIGPMADYDAHYVSPFVRTMETAAYMTGDEDVRWTDMPWIIERDWGDYGRATREEQRERYARTFQHKKIDPIFARLDGGESNLDVMMRVRSVYDTLHRQHSRHRVMMIGHGGIMNVVLNDLERLWVDEWREREMDNTYDLDNCTMLRFNRIDPMDPEHIEPTIRWRQIIDPFTDNDPVWVELTRRQRRTAKELLDSVKNVERLLGETS